MSEREGYLSWEQYEIWLDREVVEAQIYDNLTLRISPCDFLSILSTGILGDAKSYIFDLTTEEVEDAVRALRWHDPFWYMPLNEWKELFAAMLPSGWFKPLDLSEAEVEGAAVQMLRSLQFSLREAALLQPEDYKLPEPSDTWEDAIDALDDAIEQDPGDGSLVRAALSNMEHTGKKK